MSWSSYRLGSLRSVEDSGAGKASIRRFTPTDFEGYSTVSVFSIGPVRGLDETTRSGGVGFPYFLAKLDRFARPLGAGNCHAA